MSSDSDVSGIGAARTFSPLDCSGLMTWPQLEPSAHAPWTSTTLAVVSDSLILVSRLSTKASSYGLSLVRPGIGQPLGRKAARATLVSGEAPTLGSIGSRRRRNGITGGQRR